ARRPAPTRRQPARHRVLFHPRPRMGGCQPVAGAAAGALDPALIVDRERQDGPAKALRQAETSIAAPAPHLDPPRMQKGESAGATRLKQLKCQPGAAAIAP